ncbi:DJ-1/PfpI family protein [Paenibacillus sediminis]|uniref:4-methyl-5(B-hydroxyethyl)-thiazole monophosphate biosynthesis n=1 Tax=Paenibacillus sediminis TaxID=664909 RepID=A0ABS4H1Y7_9BACL|nr:DJ-1/PfpI family protein [Paenibacillus sediminis]MBP1936530.1 4-methyl-5(b-hydroxyethyl)-thiazole monophosphate biosynthesis [Paenibacillus sediminis]
MGVTGVILYPLFSEYELTVALSILKQGGKPITTIGITSDPIKGESDLTCVTDTTIYDADISALDSIVFPGCMDISTLFGNEDLIHFIQKCAQKEDFLFAAISSSPYLLAKSGLLENKKYTIGMLPEHRTELGLFNEDNYSNDLVVKDGHIITARGRGFIDFGIQLGKALKLDFDPRWYVSE